MERVTSHDVMTAVDDFQITQLRLQACKACKSSHHYQFHRDGHVSFHSGCGGARCDIPSRNTCSLDAVVTSFNRETPTIRQQMWSEFITSGAPVYE